MAVPIVVCACGVRMRAPGARPGRVGRCPGCGASIRVPDAPAGRGPSADARPSTSPRRPAKFEGLLASHLYPFRDANGLAYLAVMPVAWWVVAMGPFLLASSIVAEDQLSELARVAFVPSLLGVAPALCYTLAFLSRAFEATVAGDDRPPRWPDLEIGPLLWSATTWAAAMGSGIVVGGLPAWLFWTNTANPGRLDRAVAAGLLALGAVYAQAALAAGLCLNDLMAMNPATVLKGIRGFGPGLFRPLIYATAAGAAAAWLLVAALRPMGPWVALPAWLLFWAFATYEALVTTRILGVECRRRSRALGWFRRRSRPKGLAERTEARS